MQVALSNSQQHITRFLGFVDLRTKTINADNWLTIHFQDQSTRLQSGQCSSGTWLDLADDNPIQALPVLGVTYLFRQRLDTES